MVTVQAGALLLFLLLLPLPSTPTMVTLYVIPTPNTPCPAHPCHTLFQYVENATEYFTSNTTMIFLPGEHTLMVQANVTNITGFSMVGESSDVSKIICNASECGGFYFENVLSLCVSSLGFISDSHSITAVYVDDLQIMNCSFANSTNTTLIAHNSSLLLEGNTFANNSGGNVHKMTFTPGGGIAVAFGNITFLGQNTFLNNTCTSNICGGGAVYAEKSRVIFGGNTSFIDNIAKTSVFGFPAISGGGGLLLLSSVINITGHMDFINNSVSNPFVLTNACVSGGGGASLLFCIVSISGRVMFSNNSAKGESGCGGGIFLNGSNVTITGNMVLTDNSAGHAGGGINMIEGSMSASGTLVLSSNLAGNFGIAKSSNEMFMADSLSNRRRLLLTDNYAGNDTRGQGGGLNIERATTDITGTLSLGNNSAGYQGGGIATVNTSMTVSGKIILFTNNSARSFGGGIVIYGSNITIKYAFLRDNYAGIQGGGINVQGSNMFITGKVSLSRNSASTNGGGIAMVDSSNLTMRNALLTENYAGSQGGGQGGGFIADEGGNIIITGNVSFVNNSADFVGGGILILSINSMDISGMVLLTTNSAATYGGGIGIFYSTVIINGSVLLTNNYAGQSGSGRGGGLYVVHSSMNITGSLLVSNNSADYQGGAIGISSSSMTVSGNMSLTNNLARSYGGGIASLDSNITMRNSLLCGNNAGSEGGGIDAQGGNLFIGEGVSFINNSANLNGGGITIITGNVSMTGNVSFISNHADSLGGGIILQKSSVGIPGTVSLTNNSANNEGGGIYMQFSTLDVSGRVVLTNNRCEKGYGGGISSFQSCLEIVGKMYFTENYALQGGALYVFDDTPLVYCATNVGAECVIEDCFFQFPNVSLSLDNLLVFDGNVANAGSVLYGGSVDRCRLDGHPETDSGEVFDMIANYSQQPDTQSVVSSNPFRVCLCDKSQPNCSDSGSVTAYPGQTIPISVAAVGQRNGMRYAMINAITNPLEISKVGVSEDRQSVDNNCTKLHYTFFSNLTNIKLIMYLDGPCSSEDASVNRLTIPVQLLLCPPAFALSELPYGCICEERLQQYTNSCNINDQSILRDGDFWVGYDNRLQGLILHPHCPFDYCQTKSIHFTLNNTDLQCEFNRTGLLCGACKPKFSLVLGSSRCLPCSDFYLFLLLLFAIMGLALVVILLVCKLTVAVGTLSGLIFYANIVGANQTIFFPSGSTNPLTVFIAWVNLDLGIEICFYDGMDTSAKTWLQFVFPIYIWTIIGLIIFISGCSHSISRILGSNPVAVLATLILLSYTKILRTIISALSFTTLQYPNDKTEVVWLYNANISYLHNKHIPLFVVGLLFFVLAFLPYTLLLLLGQWLQAFSHLKILSWANNLKLKAFLDAYYAPYNGKHCYWTGLLLVLRFALLLVFGTSVLGDSSENLLAISAASFGLLVWPWMFANVYKKWYLSALEASYLLNLGILAVATNYVKQAGGNQAAVAYTSTGIAFATFIAIVPYHIYLQIKEFFPREDNLQPHVHGNDHDRIPVEDAGDKPLVAPSTTYVSYGSGQFREPLLNVQ